MGETVYNWVDFQSCLSEHGNMHLFSGNFRKKQGEFAALLRMAITKAQFFDSVNALDCGAVSPATIS